MPAPGRNELARASRTTRTDSAWTELDLAQTRILASTGFVVVCVVQYTISANNWLPAGWILRARPGERPYNYGAACGGDCFADHSHRFVKSLSIQPVAVNNEEFHAMAAVWIPQITVIALFIASLGALGDATTGKSE